MLLVVGDGVFETLPVARAAQRTEHLALEGKGACDACRYDIQISILVNLLVGHGASRLGEAEAELVCVVVDGERDALGQSAKQSRRSELSGSRGVSASQFFAPAVGLAAASLSAREATRMARCVSCASRRWTFVELRFCSRAGAVDCL